MFGYISGHHTGPGSGEPDGSKLSAPGGGSGGRGVLPSDATAVPGAAAWEAATGASKGGSSEGSGETGGKL